MFLFLCFTCEAKRLHKEFEYQQVWCKQQNGLLEYKLEDSTRVDCLLSDKAVEFDFANKWAECIGQCLYYGKKTNRTPACALIMENGESDLKYLKRFEEIAKQLNIEIIQITPEVFKNKK